MHIESLFSPGELQRNIDGGYVSTQTHPNFPLTIYNYTPSAQYEREWNEVTTQSRGLIVNSDTGEIVARPFGKFFNYQEHVDSGVSFPRGNPSVSEKMDGSLGIIYTYDNKPYVATRGSFTSDQAVWATKFLHENLPRFTQPSGITTLVEIIYPDNRIVVDYGNTEGLFAIAAIDNETGADLEEIGWWPGPFAPLHGVMDHVSAYNLAVDDRYDEDEGVVLTWFFPDKPSFRVKVKHPRYVELHRVVTNLTSRSVHEALSNGTFDFLLEVAPDEFHPWMRSVQQDLLNKFNAISYKVNSDLQTSRHRARDRYHDAGYTRKDLATFVKMTEYPGLVFALEDGKDITKRIWDMIVPEPEKAKVV